MADEKHEKKSLGQRLDSILPPEKIDAFVGKTKEMISGLMSKKDAASKEVKKETKDDEKK